MCLLSLVQNCFLILEGTVRVLDIVRKHDAVAAPLPFHSEQGAIQVSHDAQDLHAFVRKMNFAAARISNHSRTTLMRVAVVMIVLLTQFLNVGTFIDRGAKNDRTFLCGQCANALMR